MQRDWRGVCRVLTGLFLVLSFVYGDQNMWGIHLAVVSVAFATLALSCKPPSE
jgi:hypothetical protein